MCDCDLFDPVNFILELFTSAEISGSEVTLVAGSDTSEDSMDSLENQKIPSGIPSFVISEPCENQPSITRGIGRKTSQENDQFQQQNQQQQKAEQEEFFLRGGSYSDDSLSNDSLSVGNQSPSSSSNSAFDAEIRTRPVVVAEDERGGAEAGSFRIFGNLDLGFGEEAEEVGNGRFVVRNEPTFEVELSEVCSKLEPSDILEMLRRTINDQVGGCVTVELSVFDSVF